MTSAQLVIIFLSAFLQYECLRLSNSPGSEHLQPVTLPVIDQEFENFVDDMDLNSVLVEGETERENFSNDENESPTKKINLGIKQVSKCGSTFLSKLIPKIAKKLNVEFRNIGERQGLNKETRSGHFIVASVRNPCSYYPSLWAYQMEKKPWATEQNEKYGFFGGDSTNVSQFHKWVDVVEGTQHGIMTVRHWETLVDGHDGLKCWGTSLPTCAKEFDDANVLAAMKTYSPKAVADCWVHTETMVDDLKGCLKKYANLTGVTMDWGYFQEEIENLKVVNPSKHLPCESYYDGSGGKKYQDLIRSQDAYLFEKFGYRTCCGAPTQPMQ